MANQVIAFAQLVALDKRHRNIAVGFAGQITLRAQKAVAVRQNIKNAAHFQEALGNAACFENCINKLGFFHARYFNAKLDSTRA